MEGNEKSADYRDISNPQKKPKKRQDYQENSMGDNSRENTTADKKMKRQGKVTDLYLVLGETVSESSDVKSYIRHRIGDRSNLDFDIINISMKNIEDQPKCIITVRFKSLKNASEAKRLLHASNRNATSRIHCFFDKLEAEGDKATNMKKRMDQLEKALVEVVETAKCAVDKHENKITEVCKKVEEAELKIRKGISLLDFNQLTSERDALLDKKTELDRQRSEFSKYIQSMKTKLGEIVSHEKFENELKEIRKSFGVECQRLSTALPMYARREDILNCISSNQVSVILGETGSGKSTQMVQYLYQAGFAANGLIACTQPRKIAAVSLATHVASELASSVGQIVGYKVGMQSKTSGATKVIFMTDHILLNECLSDKSLAKYSCVIIDEAHERSIHTDLLLGMLKECLLGRPNLKVIITSATIDPDVFVKYFGGKHRCPVLQVSGRTFPVEVYWGEEGNESSFPDDYETKALKKAEELHKATKTEDGDILVFLTSPVETEKCVERLKASVKEDNILCLPLHGRLKPEEQQLVFATTPVGKRKVVFATNSAETSITIPGIKFVIDTGVVKEMRYDPNKNMNALSVVAVSQSSANQRKGRAGRTASGICYRLYSEKDYKEMDTSSNPEILRVQVSQALLKLMELGVDPLHFDYVQSPSIEAMKIAYNELKSIGVAADNGLSELGRWVARMPVEPKLGVFIKKGIDLDMTLETLVVASSCTQTGIFFRAGSSEEKKMADMKKVKFCHNRGDLLTMLNVFREWDAAKEKEKGKWCMENSINGKAMKGIRDMVNEIIFILKKEFDMKVKHEFKLPEEVDLSLHSLISRCMRDNLAYYLGHDSAGYLIIDRMQMVQIHPSSSVLSLGKRSPWVVFGKVLQTSADYITEVTPLSEDDVMSIVRETQTSINVSELEKYKVRQTLLVNIGDHVFWKLVGPMHAYRRRLEDEIRVVCNAKSVFIEANKKLGELRLFCNKECEKSANHLFQKAIKDVSTSLLIESREESLGKDKTVRAVLREGGAVSDILMPNEYRAFNVKQKETSHKITEEDIRKCLEIHGEIEQIYMMNNRKNYQSPYCGKVTFVRATDARTCATTIKEDVNGILELHPLLPESKTIATENHYGYTIRLTWCRRPSKGHAYVYLNRPEDKSRLLMSSLSIKGFTASIVSSKRNSDLTIKGLPNDVLEEQVKESLANQLGISAFNIKDRFRIVIPRVNLPVIENERHNIQQQLVRSISQYVTPNSYSVNVKEFKQQNVTCVAFVSFSDLQTFFDAGKALKNNPIRISGNEWTIGSEYKASISLRKQLYGMIKDDIDHFTKVFVDEIPGTSIDIQQLKTGHFRLNIKCTTPENLAKVKVSVDGIVSGDYLEADKLRILFSRNGRQLAKDIGEKTKTLIFIDDRQQKVNIQGLAENRKKAIEMIDKFISKHSALTEETLCLKGHPGLLRNLFVTYGADFSKLKAETEIFAVTVNLRSHDLTISGEADNVAKAISVIKTAHCGQKLQTLEEVIGDCPICLCQVEHSCMSRLEYCGHSYCKPCLDSLIQAAITDRQFPIVCAKEGCDKPLVMRDLNKLIKNGTVNVTNLLDGAVANFVSMNKSKYHFCSTPDCGLVYRVSESATMHMCPACRTQICSACHVPYHAGLTCEQYKSAKGDGDLLLWLKADPNNRKRCPKCGVGIEKNGGCHHMTCTCGAHVCWMCLEHFKTSQECYGHMQTSHGTFV